MKKIGTVTAVLAAAAIGLTMFSACGKKEEEAAPSLSAPETYEAFDVTNYAHPLDSAYAENYFGSRTLSTTKAPTRLVKKNYESLVALGNFAKAECEDGTYVLYDIQNDSELFKNLTSLNVSSYSLGSDSVYVYILGETKNGDATYGIAGPDGKRIASGLASNNISLTRTGTYAEDDQSYYIMTLTYRSGDETIIKNYSYNKSAEGGITWEELDVIPESPNRYEIGETLSPVTKIIDDEIYPDCVDALKDYEVVTDRAYDSYTGVNVTTLTYYKDGQSAGSITLTGADVLGYVGDYLFYVQNTTLPADYTGEHNIEYPSAQAKGLSEIYRYNVVKGGEAEKLNVDYVALGLSYDITSYRNFNASLYNYATNKFDRLVVCVGQKSNGVYVSQNPMIYCVIDESGEIQAQVTGNASITGISQLIKLTDSTFLSGVNIVDRNLSTVSALPNYNSISLWEEQSLLLASYNYNSYVAVDFQGKAAINLPASGTYGNIYYFDSAVVTTSGSSYDLSATVYSKKYPNGKNITEIVGSSSANTQVTYAGGVILKTVMPSSMLSATTLSTTAYNLNGERIGDMTLSTSSSSTSNIGNMLIAKGIENDKSVIYILK